ncbi:acetylcholine receptor subunit beta-like [Mya arenaria]|uniref:acetylcholine receptor subunit beta-like n=1 Tax=Mya arenaria TaxID=6604 RepID=UPI0022E51C0E|nr:acetylcholine receptor subunit beta-like [Mya arenaria]
MGAPWINVYLVYLLLLCPLVVCYTTTHAGNLATALKAASNTDVRPSGSTEVYIQLGIMSVDSLDIVVQEFTMIGFLLMSWEDSRLTWSSSDYGGIEGIHLKKSEIWAPLVLLNNGGSSIEMINDNSDTASTTAYIFSDGNVAWLAPVVFRTHCSVNIAYYPFDKQSCTLIISTWMYGVDELMLYTDGSQINFDLYEENGEWAVLSSSSSNTTRTLLGHAMSAVQFDITLQRKYQFYLLNIIFPITMLAVLGPFVFLLPVDSGEKNGFTLTVMLSMSVTMAYISDHIPSSALNVCVLSVYVLTVFIINVCETLLTVITCRIHNHHGKGLSPSARSQTIMGLLAKLTRFKSADHERGQKKLNKLNSIFVADKQKGQHQQGDQADSPTAWASEERLVHDFTYEEYAILLDRFNFMFFLILTGIMTLVFMVILAAGA